MLPKSIRIGLLDYRIVLVDELTNDEGHQLYGQLVFDECIIKISKKHLRSQRLPIVLLHEILHGILEDVTADTTEEELVLRLAPALISVMRENPYLVFFLVNGVELVSRPCDFCDEYFTKEEWNERHEGHEKDCPNYGLNEPKLDCACNLVYHHKCCPECKEYYAK